MFRGMSERPKKKRDDWITRAQARDKWFPLSMMVVAFVGVMSRNKAGPEWSLDFVMFCAVVAFIAWCLWPSSRDDDGTDH